MTAIGLALCLVSPPVMLGNFTRLPGATENTRRYMLGNFTRLLGATEIREDLCDFGLILPNCLIPGPFQAHCMIFFSAVRQDEVVNEERVSLASKL